MKPNIKKKERKGKETGKGKERVNLTNGREVNLNCVLST